MKKILEVSTIWNVMFDKIYVIEKQLCAYVCGTWNTWDLGDSKTNHLLFLAYRNAASVLLLGMESVDRYKFFLGRNKPSPHYCSDRELKELGL